MTRQDNMVFGIIGAGSIARVHAEALSRIEGASIEAIADVVPEAANRLAQQFQIGRVYDDYRELLRSPSIEAVTICTPNYLHAEQAIAAAAHGKHVLVEKPMSRTTAEAAAVIDACRSAGVTLGAVFQNRFSRLAGELRSLLQSGELGSLVMAKTSVDWYRTQQYFDVPWRASREGAGGGVLMVQAIHYLDLMLWLAGPFERVLGASIATLSHDAAVEDTAAAVLRFRNGALGVVEATLSSFPETPARIEILGTEGKATWEDDFFAGRKTLRVFTKNGERVLEEGIAQSGPASSASERGATPAAFQSSADHEKQVEDFIDAIRHARAPKVDGEEGGRVLRLIGEIYKAASVESTRLSRG